MFYSELVKQRSSSATLMPNEFDFFENVNTKVNKEPIDNGEITDNINKNFTTSEVKTNTFELFKGHDKIILDEAIEVDFQFENYSTAPKVKRKKRNQEQDWPWN